MFLSRCLTRHTTAISLVRGFHASPSLFRRKPSLFRRRPFTPGEDRVILQLHKENKSVSEIGEIISRPISSIYARFKLVHEPYWNASIKRHDIYTAEEKQLLYRLKNEGNSWKEICVHFPNRSRESLQAIINRDKVLRATRKTREEFASEEDALILELRDKTTPSTPWVEIARRLGAGRRRDTIKNRYYKVLVPDSASRTPALDPRFWTAAQVQLLKDQLALGTPDFEIAAMLGKTKGAIQQKINFFKRGSCNVDPLKSQSEKGYRWPTEKVEQLRSLKLSGHSYDEIANQLGMSISAVYIKWHRLQQEDKRRAISCKSDDTVESPNAQKST